MAFENLLSDIQWRMYKHETKLLNEEQFVTYMMKAN